MATKKTKIQNPFAPTGGQKVLKLLGKYALFARSKARYPGIFGGYAAGKTTTCSIVGLDMALRYPGITGAVIRRAKTELKASTKDKFMTVVRTFDYGKPTNRRIMQFYNEQNDFLRLRNGSTVFFLHTKSEGLYRGPEFGWFFIDQAEEIEEGIARLITTRLRQPGFPHKGMFAGNTNMGHNWNYHWFVLKEKSNTDLYMVTMEDNRDNLDPEFYEEMQSYPEEWKRINLYGDWDEPGGLVLDVKPEQILDKFSPPPYWRKVIAIDPAEGAGTCGSLIGYITTRGEIIVFNEYYEKNKIIPEHAAGILRVANGEYDVAVMDATSYGKRQSVGDTFYTVAQRYAQYGISAIPAIQNINVSIDVLNEYAKPDKNRKHILTGRPPGFKLYFVKDNLPILFRQINGWMRANPSREPIHLGDALRYLVASGLAPPRAPIFKKKKAKLGFLAM